MTAAEGVPMADDDRQQLLPDPTPFAPTELLAEDIDHSVDVGDASVDVNYTLDVDHDVPVRRIEAGVLAFALLVVGVGVLTPVAATVQVSACWPSCWSATSRFGRSGGSRSHGGRVPRSGRRPARSEH